MPASSMSTALWDENGAKIPDWVYQDEHREVNSS